MTVDHQHPMSRGASILRYGLFLLAACLVLGACSRQEAVELNFAFGPDDTGTVGALIKDFNREHKGSISINWIEGSRSSNEFYRQIAKDKASDDPQMDVIGADVVWTSALAQAGWVEDLSSSFFADYDQQSFVKAAIDASTYQAKFWGVPWYMDAGVLFYRKDLLQQHGYDQPPATWAELRTVAKDIMDKEYVKYGYVFQGANYEGGVVNACEFIWNAGGELLIGDLSAGTNTDESASDISVITVNSAAAKQGLNEAQQMIDSGVSPREVAFFRELEGTNAFAEGDAVFLRNWPSAYPQLLEELTAEQIGVATLPVSRENMPSYSCLGGWNLMVADGLNEEKQAAAWTFIRYLTEIDQQRRMAIEGGNLPSLRSLYDDASLRSDAPFIPLAAEVIERARTRPVTPQYMLISPDIAWTFTEVLKGDLNPTEAVETMQGQMEGAMAVK